MNKVADDMLMAFSDGELDAAAAAEVTRTVAADPSLARRVEDFRRTRRLAKEALDATLAEPLSHRAAATILRGAPSPARRPMLRMVTSALAASVVVAAGLGGYLLGGRGAAPGSPDLLAAGPALMAALDRALTGEAVTAPGSGAARALGTFRVGDSVCRSFSVTRDQATTIRGLGCHLDDHWEIELAIAERGDAAHRYAPASETASASLESVLESLGADGPLDTEAERQLRERGWRP
jgi:hypothetical protein